MRVLVIPEDFRNDQYLLKPLVESLLAAVGRPRARVRVMTDPLLGGIDRALDFDTLQNTVFPRYRGMVDHFLLIVDRDGRAGRRQALAALALRACQSIGKGKCFLAENAYQEIEVWALGGASLPAGWTWSEIRDHPNPKEAYFRPFAVSRDLLDEPGEGRQTLGQEAAKRLARVRALCPELDQLAERIQSFVTDDFCRSEPFNPT